MPCCRVLDTLKATVTLLARQGFEAPQWHQLLGDDAPQPHDVEDDAPGIGRGWQKAASAALDLDAASAAMPLSQSGPCSAQVFLMLPVCPELFRVLLLRRLRLPLPFVPARCRCGREQDALGDHRSACPRSGVLRARGGPLERAAARICREAGAVVAMHTLVRDLNVGSVPNGLPLWGGMQLAVDTTLVSALSSTGAPRRYQNRAEGAALRQARRAKERTYPELLRPDSRCRLVVLRLRLAGASARKPWTSCSGWRGRVREVCRLVCAAPCRLPLPGAGPPSWPRARAGRTLPASWPCPPIRPQVSMGRRPWSVTCLLTAGSRLPRAAVR